METPGQSVKLFQVNNKDTRTMTLASFLWVFTDSFEQILRIGLVLLLLTLNKYMLAGLTHYKVVGKTLDVRVEALMLEKKWSRRLLINM